MRGYLEYNTEIKKSTFKELLEKDNSVTIHVKNLQVLVTKVQSAK